MILKDTKRYPVSPPIESKCEKIWTRKIPNTDTVNMLLGGLNRWKTFDTVVRSDLAPFVQFKRHEKKTWRSVTFSNVLLKFSKTLLKVTYKSNISPWVFFTFFKLYKWHQFAQSVTIYHDFTLQNLNVQISDKLLIFIDRYLKDRNWSIQINNNLSSEKKKKTKSVSTKSSC